MTNKSTKTIDSTAENWESGKLGLDADYVEVAPDIDQTSIDDAFDLQPISIRLENALIEDFKAFSRIYGVGYQPLIRQVLKRFADGEKKKLIRQYMAEQRKMEESCEPAPIEDDPKAA